MKHLRHLELHGTKVTAAGLPHLEKLTSLQTLVLPAEIDPEAVENLRKSLPNCAITTG